MSTRADKYKKQGKKISASSTRSRLQYDTTPALNHVRRDEFNKALKQQGEKK